ncbi:MAG: SGNH/GDSL hydrolase family protein [Nitrospirota bacterium]
MKPRFLFPIAAITLSFLTAFVFVEVALRIAGLGYGSAPLESDPAFHHVHPANYRFVVHTPDGEYGGHTVYYDKDRLISETGRKQTAEDIGSCRIAFMGDSFTEAAQVEYGKSFVGILSHSTSCKTWNFAVSSYSPIFYLLQWRQTIKNLRPTLVVVQLFSNDVSSDSEYYSMATLDRNGQVTAIPGPGGGWLASQSRKLYLLRYLRKTQLMLKWILFHREEKSDVVGGTVEENPDITQLSSDLMSALSTEVLASGAKFAFFAVPSKARQFRQIEKQVTPEFSDKWKRWAEERKISYIDLVPAFRDEAGKGVRLFFERDIHLNELGNAVVAREIARRYPEIFYASAIQQSK